MGRCLGTDSFRDKANMDLIVEHAYKTGRFLGWCYGQKILDKHYRMVIGKDTRHNSYMFEYSLVTGLTASGADVYLLRVTTTPSVSYVVCTEGFNCGIMISAGHNPLCGNGIKIISERGEKLGESVIPEIEKYLDGETAKIPPVKRERTGRIVDLAAERNRCIGYLISITTRSFKNMKVTLGCSNGSTSTIAGNVLDVLETETHVVNNKPSRLSINTNCSSTHIKHLQKSVVDEKCDIGLVYDGDAGRCIMVDRNGYMVDGDSIMYVCDEYMKEQGSLFNNTAATTIMSNFRLYKTLDREGIAYMETAVGNKYVCENMVAIGHCLGGEQSGHIIFSKHATTGGGILTSLKVMEVVLEKKQPLDKLASEVEIYPQILRNIRVKDKKMAQNDETMQAKVARVTRSLDNDGKILLRQLGTEPVVRVMMGAPNIRIYEAYVDQVIQVMKDRGHYI